MLLVLGVIALVVVNYHQLVARFPAGGGAAAAAGDAFGTAWSFPPLAALIVDYGLTIAISVAAASSAVISYAPGLSAARVPMALGLAAAVGALIALGHRGRTAFAAMTVLFASSTLVVLVVGFASGSGPAGGTTGPTGGSPLFAVLYAFPVAMALATGIEAPASGIAELGRLDDAGRVRFARVTLWMTLATVGLLTVGLTLLARQLGVSGPRGEATLVAVIAEAAVGRGTLFATFQLASVLLLLAAASSSYQAGSGVLKALGKADVVAGAFRRTNRRGVPVWGVAAFGAVAAGLVAVAGAREQTLVLFYAVAVFVSFLFGLLAMLRRSWTEGRRGLVVVNAVGSAAVGATIVMNLLRGRPLISIAAVAVVSAGIYGLWVRAGRRGKLSPSTDASG